MTRSLVRKLLLLLVGVLYVASIPWYRTTGAEPELIFGLPDWVAIALGCYVAAALCNSLAWMLTDIDDDEARS